MLNFRRHQLKTSLALAATLLGLLSAAPAQAQTIKMKLSHPYPTVTQHHKHMEDRKSVV